MKYLVLIALLCLVVAAGVIYQGNDIETLKLVLEPVGIIVAGLIGYLRNDNGGSI